jgi:hypothetical protein
VFSAKTFQGHTLLIIKMKRKSQARNVSSVIQENVCLKKANAYTEIIKNGQFKRLPVQFLPVAFLDTKKFTFLMT